MAQKTVEVGTVDREKTIYYFDFEPDLGKQHLPEIKFEGNNLDDVFRHVVKEMVSSTGRELRDSYILNSVGRFG